MGFFIALPGAGRRIRMPLGAGLLLLLIASVTLSAFANAAPQVSLTSPSPLPAAPAQIVLSASATDSDGQIVRVRFYRGTTLLGTDLSAPYSFSWKATAPGSYSFTARAEDNAGGVTTSAAVVVVVGTALMPTVSIAATDAAAAESGGNTATFTVSRSGGATTGALTVGVQRSGTATSGTDYAALPATLTIAAGSASGTLTISPINDAVAEPSETVVVSLAAGTGYAIGASASATATIADDDSTTNAAPSVSLTSPSSGASFTAPATVTLAATASDSDGIARVEFLNGTAVVATDTTSPYSFTWSNVADGSYAITARATDTRGAIATSAARSITVAQAPTTGLHYYASPVGSATGDGTLARPWDLGTALDAPIQPGATLWLRGGTYRGSFTSFLDGTASAPIMVRQYPGERAILDGASSTAATLDIRGDFGWYWGFEVMNSDPRRVSSQSGSSPSDISRNDAVLLYGSNVKLINLIIHDAADGVGFWQQAENSELYGCVIFNNGWRGTDRGHGHGIYGQNSAGTKRITDVISVNNFATGVKAYATNTYASGFGIDGLIAFNNGSPAERGKLYRQPNLFVGTTTNPSDRITISDTHLYHVPEIEPDLGANLVLGYLAKNNGTISITDSHIIGGSMAVKMAEWQRATFRGNTLQATSSSVNTSKQRLVDLLLPAGASSSAYSWSTNEYFDATAVQSSGLRLPFVFNGGAKSTFAQWKQNTGFDGTSSYAVGVPQTTEIVVQPNRYETGRAHVIVYNWQQTTSVEVDLSAVLTTGMRYEVRTAEDFLGAPVASGTYDGTRVRLPLSGLRVATPIGYDFTPASTAPAFAVFIVVPR